jgi:hypothetical protein
MSVGRSVGLSGSMGVSFGFIMGDVGLLSLSSVGKHPPNKNNDAEKTGTTIHLVIRCIKPPKMWV